MLTLVFKGLEGTRYVPGLHKPGAVYSDLHSRALGAVMGYTLTVMFNLTLTAGGINGLSDRLYYGKHI